MPLNVTLKSALYGVITERVRQTCRERDPGSLTFVKKVYDYHHCQYNNNIRRSRMY